MNILIFIAVATALILIGKVAWLHMNAKTKLFLTNVAGVAWAVCLTFGAIAAALLIFVGLFCTEKSKH